MVGHYYQVFIAEGNYFWGTVPGTVSAAGAGGGGLTAEVSDLKEAWVYRGRE